MSSSTYRPPMRRGVQLCNPFEETRLRKWGYLYTLSQPKLDGDRCIIRWVEGKPKLFSSEGNVFETVPHIQEQLMYMFPHSHEEEPPILDGELYVHGMEHELIHGIVSASRVSLHPLYEKMELHLFDIQSDDKQWDRLCHLGRLRTDLPNIHFVETSRIDASAAAVMQRLRFYKEEGYEGIIIRHPFGVYHITNGNTRSPHVMKFKPMKQDQYLICGYSIELDKYNNPKDNSLGRLICCGKEVMPPEWFSQYPATYKPPKGYFAIGTGFTHQVRRELWEQREELKFRWVIINYQHITSANKVPRHGVFESLVEGV